MEDRKKNLELFAKQLSEGLPFAEDFINQDADIENNSLLARNLSEDALAHQVLQNTGVPIPNKGAAPAKVEDFLNRVAVERYPEIKDPNIRLGNEDSYHKGKILVNPNNRDITQTVGKSLHEMGHSFDDQVLGQAGKNLDLKTLRDAKKSGLDLKSLDPAAVYEMYAKGHHSEIPNLREGSFGLGALKSMMKSGTFKQVAGAIPLAGAALAATSGDANAMVYEGLSEIPGYEVIRSDNAGSAEDDKEIKNEVAARKSYDASSARKDALKKLGQ